MAQSAERSSAYRIELLTKSHDRTAFGCSIEPLDRYLKVQASQDMRRRVASCFVAIDAATSEIAGYYTLAATGLPLDLFPDEIIRRLPRYPVVPAGLLGRLAVSTKHQGKSLGKAMLFDALRRIAETDLMAFALVVDAKDDAAVSFYEHFGFVGVAGDRRKLVLPIATVLPLIRGGSP